MSLGCAPDGRPRQPCIRSDWFTRRRGDAETPKREPPPRLRGEQRFFFWVHPVIPGKLRGPYGTETSKPGTRIPRIVADISESAASSEADFRNQKTCTSVVG